MNAAAWRDLAYLIAIALFILDLKWMAHPRTAVRGNLAGVAGMAIAIIATLLGQQMTWSYVVTGALAGSVIGAVVALRVKMTAMPEMVGLLNGLGGAASVLVGGAVLLAAADALRAGGGPGIIERIFVVVATIIGSVTLFGSFVAFGKLAEFLAVKWKLKPWQNVVKYGAAALCVAAGLSYAWVATGDRSTIASGIPDAWLAYAAALSFAGIGGLLLLRRDRFPGINAAKITLALASLAIGCWLVVQPTSSPLFWLLAGVAGLLGVLLTWSIGGADMPVAIALLNSYSGLAGAATGFLIGNSVLIVAGSLVGASGIILTRIMCRAMNRSMTNVLFGALGPTGDTPLAEEVYKTVKSTSPEEIAMTLDGARRVVIVPGYGLAVAQAQHAVRQFAQLLEERGAVVEYAIHPVAGRMPGHMNVLLAEANVPYDKLREMDDINAEMDQVDVAIVIGANDVVNPVAETDPKSAIAGMPIIQAYKARTVIVVKRSLAAGFAGIPNPLFAAENTLMFFSDGRKAVQDLIAAVKEAS